MFNRKRIRAYSSKIQDKGEFFAVWCKTAFCHYFSYNSITGYGNQKSEW